MKKKILEKLNQIEAIAKLTEMEGKVSLQFSGCSMIEWDDAVNSITEYPRYNHFVEVTPKLQVALLI